jgi:hypothetical protein
MKNWWGTTKEDWDKARYGLLKNHCDGVGLCPCRYELVSAIEICEACIARKW